MTAARRLLGLGLGLALAACGDDAGSAPPERPSVADPAPAPPTASPPPSAAEPAPPSPPLAVEPAAPAPTEDLLRTTPAWVAWPPCMRLEEPSGLFSVRVISPRAVELPTCAEGARQVVLHVPEDAGVRALRLVGVEGAGIERIAVCRAEPERACTSERALAEVLHPTPASGEIELTFEASGGDFAMLVEPPTTPVRLRAIELVGAPGASVRTVPRAPPEQLGVAAAAPRELELEPRAWVMATIPPSGPGSVEDLDVDLTRRAGRETRVVSAVRAATASGAHAVTVALVLRRTADDEGSAPLFGDLPRLGGDGAPVPLAGAIPPPAPVGGTAPEASSPAATPGVLLRGPSLWLDGECERPRELGIVRVAHRATGAVSAVAEMLLASDVCSPTERRMSLGDLDADTRPEVRVRAGWTLATAASDAERPRRTTEVILDLARFWQEVRVTLDELDDDTERTAEAFLDDLDGDAHDDLSVRGLARADDGSSTESVAVLLWDASTDAWLLDPHFTAPAVPERTIRLPRGFAPDPTVLGGDAGGPLSARDTLGAEDDARIATAPNHVLDVPLGLATLTLTVSAEEASVLVVRLTDGRVLSAASGAGGDGPRLTAPIPAGRHEVWVGAAGARAAFPYTLAVSETGADVSAHVGTMTFEGVPRDCGMTSPEYGPIRVGSSVVLGTDTGWTGPDGRGGRVSGHRSWDDAMYAWVGARTVVTELPGLDEAGCPYVRVVADGGRWRWRIRELRP